MTRVIFETERLIVREFSLDDLDEAFQIYSRPEVAVTLRREPAKSLDELRPVLERIVATYRNQPLGSWALVERESGRMIGTGILKALPDDEKIEVGWHLHPDFWGRGLASEFGRSALRYGFQDQDLSAIYAIVLPDNEPSIRVARRIGLRELGMTDRYHDLELAFFGLDRAAWEASQA